MTDFSWAKLAEDPNVIQWDDEAQANLQKLIADYERVKAENVKLTDENTELLKFYELFKDKLEKCEHCWEDAKPLFGATMFGDIDHARRDSPDAEQRQTCKHCGLKRIRKVVFVNDNA